MALWFPAVGHLGVGLLFSHLMLVDVGYWFDGFFRTLCH